MCEQAGLKTGDVVHIVFENRQITVRKLAKDDPKCASAIIAYERRRANWLGKKTPKPPKAPKTRKTRKVKGIGFLFTPPKVCREQNGWGYRSMFSCFTAAGQIILREAVIGERGIIRMYKHDLLHITPKICKKANWRVGDEIDVHIENREIRLEKVRK